ncbi:MAG TPA: membrane protein insertase YidC [bacterium]|nr:membrane protein insertase YidC [bacterium]
MNRNFIYFIVLSVAIVAGSQFVMQRFYPPLKAKAPVAAVTGATATGVTAAPVSVAAPLKAEPTALPSLSKAPESLVQVETGAFKVTLSSWGARFTSLKLKGILYKGKVGAEDQDQDLVPSLDQPQYGTLALPGTDLAGLNWTVLTPKPELVAGRQVVRFGMRVAGTPLQLTKTFTFSPQGNSFTVQVDAQNLSAQPVSLTAPLALLWGPNLGGNEGGMGRMPPAVVVQLDGKIERVKASGDTQTTSFDAPRWMAVKNQYFVVGFFPRQGFNKAEARNLGRMEVAGALVADGLTLGSHQSQTLVTDVYAGPLEYEALKAVGLNFQGVVQFESYKIFEWLNPVSVGLLYVMRWFHGITGNWGIAIILLTVMVRAIMFWPSLKSMVSMRRMQKKMAAMQPRLDTIKKMYKDDPSKLNSEMMKLYQEYGVNPLGGCLPMLLQIPIFFALYGTLGAAFELRGASFFWKWTDLTAGDPTYIFPLAMGVSMFLQQKLAPNNSATVSEDQAQIQKMMLWMMPIMFTFMALSMHWPVGLLLYWTASNLFGIGQQLAVNKAVD